MDLKDLLLHDLNKYGKLFVGVDFDNTVFNHRGDSETQDIVRSNLDLLKRLRSKLGDRVVFCLWSCSDWDRIRDVIVPYMVFNGIMIDFYNESPIFNVNGKPFFSVLLDDRAGMREVKEALEYIIEMEETNEK